MRTKILSAFLLLGLVFSANAQEISKNAIGLRLGDNDGFGSEVSYQRKISKNNRIELDLGWRNHKNYNKNNYYYNNNNSIKFIGLYQWVWNIDGGFNWYVGAGGGVAQNSYNYKDNNNYFQKESYTYLVAAGDIGIEYNFDFPLQLSIDLRPEIYFTDRANDDFGPDFGVSARYRF